MTRNKYELSGTVLSFLKSDGEAHDVIKSNGNPVPAMFTPKSGYCRNSVPTRTVF